MSIVIRAAEPRDKDFVIKAITEAEKSGADSISYCNIFGVTEQEISDILSNILDEEMPGQELYLPGFLIAEVDKQPAAAMSAWIEQEDGMASNMIKSNLFMYFVPREKLLNAMPEMAVVNEINIEREKNALQIESVYTAEGYRGHGLSAMLIKEHIESARQNGKQFDKVQIVLMANNESAVRAYGKAGFEVVRSRKTDNKAIFNLLSGDTKVLMERTIKHNHGKQ